MVKTKIIFCVIIGFLLVSASTALFIEYGIKTVETTAQNVKIPNSTMDDLKTVIKTAQDAIKNNRADPKHKN